MTARAPATGVDVALRNGSSLRLRPLMPDDEPALLEFLETLDDDARAMRFFGGGVSMELAARDAARRRMPGRHDLVAVAGDGRTVLAHACAVPGSDGDEAEVAFAVGAALRGEGVATTMLAHLAAAVRDEGVRRLVAYVLPGNGAMLDVFRQSGLAPVIERRDGELLVTMPAQLGPEARDRYDERDAEAAVAAVRHVLAPSSLAIVGASERPGSVGGAVLRNLLAAGFTGDLHVVNRRGGAIFGLSAVERVTDVQGPVEMVVVAVPAAAVLDVARDCARHGVRAMVVLSDGFGEAGEEGRDRQRELLEVCRGAGMRLVGPNCLGVIDTSPDVRLNASFAPQAPPSGRIAFLSQSGALGIAVIDTVREMGLGLSSFVSVGDKADLSGNDFLSYWERDPDTDVVLLYLESFGNPRKFSRVARRVAHHKPVVAVKGGRSAAGARAAGSHTGALLGTSDVTVRALFEQAGVIPVDTLSEMFDVAALLAAQPAPAGPRVGIVSNGGGLGILCADACAAAGLEVVAFSEELCGRLAGEALEGAAVGNPVDLLAAAAPRHYRHAVAAAGRSGEVDALIAIYVHPMVSEPADVAAAIRAGAREAGVPVAAVMAMADPPLAALDEDDLRVPSYRFPEDAARAVARAARHGAWLARPEDRPPELEVDVDAASAVLDEALGRGEGWLDPAGTGALLDAYGIPRPAERLVAPDPGRAGAAAADLGGAVALKAVAPGLVHRTDAGAVKAGLATPEAVRQAAEAMVERLRDAGQEPTGLLVQAMAPPGIEMLCGVVADPVFGPVVAVAAGGTAAEVLRDSAVRLTPLTRREAAEMVRSLRTFPLLDGFRGAPRADLGALEDLLVRLAALADNHPEVAEIECNPAIAGPGGVLAVDARVRIAVPEPSPPEPALRGY